MLHVPTVSVIIPTFNRAGRLPNTIESVLAQTYADWELIIVDDESSDGTAGVISAYERRDGRIRGVFQKNTGPAGARNTGVRAARGAFIAFLDDDDEWLPEKLARQVQRFEQQPELGFVYARCAVEQGGRTIDVWPTRPFCNTLRQLFRANFIPTLTVMVRRKCFEAVGGFDTTLKISDDYDLWLRLAARYPFEWVDHVVAVYHLHDSNLSKDHVQRYRDHLRLLSKVRINRQAGVTWSFKMRRIAEDRFQLAAMHAAAQHYGKAAWQYVRAVWMCPIIGLFFWDEETEGKRFTAPYRFLKPYGLMIAHTLRALRNGQDG